MKNATRFLTGFLIGGVLSAGVAILLAPQAGEDLRNQIQEGFQRIKDEVNQASEQKRAEMEQQLATLREPRRPDAEI
jgi:gas vesicle protein